MQSVTDGPKILCLMSCGRAGSKLLHSLLDRHPQILCFPRSLHFNSFWNSVSHRKDDPEYLVDSFIARYPRFFSGKVWYRVNHFDRADRLGPGQDETFSVDTGKFREEALRLLKEGRVGRDAFFLAVHYAYHHACGRELIRDSIIFCHIHATDLVDEFDACVEDFPGRAHLLVMCRHPIESINSCVKVLKMRNGLYCTEYAHYQKQVLLGEQYLLQRFPDADIKVLPFEDLHLYHKDVMDALTGWMGISWDDSLMASTMHGKLWWGNGRVPRNGTNPGWKIYEPRGLLEKKDWRVFSSLAPKRLGKCGYIKDAETPGVLTRMKLLLLVCLPTAAEWSALGSMFNPAFWLETARKVKEDISDTRIKGFDYYSGRELPEKERGPDGKRFFRQMLRQVRMLNPVMWAYYLVRRAGYYYRYAASYGGDKEKDLTLLFRGKGR